MANRYHHGDLPNALRAAAAELIVERGLGAFSLREVARRAGVSHNAPLHHFTDTTGLLTSLAVEGFEHLHAELAASVAGSDDPAQRLVALGQAYVRAGARHPGHGQVMFRNDLIAEDDPALQAAGHAAYTVLRETVADLAEAESLPIDVEGSARLCWSAMQGLLVLHPAMTHLDALAGAPPTSRDDLVVRFTETIVAGLRAAG